MIANRVLIVAFIALLSPSAASAGTFFSLDVSGDSLVTVNTATGEVTAIGHISVNLIDPDLAIFGDTIYILNSVFSERVELLAISKFDATVYSIDTLTYQAAIVLGGEGLTVLEDGTLLASFASTGVSAASNAIGEIAPGGVLINVVNYSFLNATADCDGMTTRPNGTLLWTDVVTGVSEFRLIETEYLPVPSYSLLGSVFPVRFINDLGFDGTELWGVDHTNQRLDRIDPTDGSILETVPYDITKRLFGLAGNDLALVDVSSKLEISSGARLYQNTPNPFGSRTSISFVLSARSRAEINVYDVAGRLVRQLASGDLPAGRHRIEWDGMDSRGRAAPSGTYLYELRVNGSRAETRKAIVLR